MQIGSKRSVGLRGCVALVAALAMSWAAESLTQPPAASASASASPYDPRLTDAQIAEFLPLSEELDKTYRSNDLARRVELSTKMLALTRKAFGRDSKDYAAMLRQHADILLTAGRFADSEPLFVEALGLGRQLFGPEDSFTVWMLAKYGSALMALGRPIEAEPPLAEALRLTRKLKGPEAVDTIERLENYGTALVALNRYEDAEPILTEAYRLRRKIHAPRNYAIPNMVNTYLPILRYQGRDAEAVPLLEEALSVARELYGPTNPVTITTLNNYAIVLQTLGRRSEAEPLLAEATRLSRDIFGPGHPNTLRSEGNLASLRLALPSDAARSIEPARSAVSAIRQARSAIGFSPREEGQLSRDSLRQNEYFTLLANADWAVLRTNPADAEAIRREAFQALQDAMAGTTSSAVALAAARRGAEKMGDGLGPLVAERQSLADQWRSNEKDLARALGAIEGYRAAEVDRLSGVAKMLDARMTAIDARLRRDAPGYYAMTRPQALTLEQAVSVLRPDEAILMVVPTSFGTHVMVLTQEGLRWIRNASAETFWINASVGALRADLDPQRASGDAGPGAPSFDRKAAHQLYNVLIKPLLPALAGKTQLFIAADGALATLPFGVLVTEEPKGDDASPQALRDTHWFEDDFALVQIPSLQSLYYLRTYGAKPAAGDNPRDGFVGFGDPLLDGDGIPRGRGLNRPITMASLTGTGRTRDGGALADVTRLRTLPRLPGTAIELENIRAALGAPASAIHLGAEATETRVRTASLLDDRVIVFATHGVVGGEIGGITEPGLVMTPPWRPTSEDDGYLSASEITALKLNADWVILSACNTAAGDGAGAPGLSGLARAFFYAGARNLLASHWPVRDDVAARITAGTLQRLQADRSLSRAKALQLATQNIRNTPEDPSTAHPAAWAPFTLIGDGD